METQIRCACGTPIPIGDIPAGTSVPCPGCGRPFFRAGGRVAASSALSLAAMILGLIPCTGLIGFVLGLVALFRGSGGRGMAWTGVGAGLLWSLLAAVAALTYPLLAGGAAEDHEAHGLDAVTRIGIAQENYRTSYSTKDDPDRIGHYWIHDVAGLHYAPAAGEGIRNLIPTELADADTTGAERWTGQPASPAPYHGYYVRLIPLPAGEIETDDLGFAACAYPAQYGSTGKLTFIRNHAGRTFSRDTGGAPPAEWPADPIAGGWSSR